MEDFFSQEQLESIADALGDTEFGLTGSEIAFLIKSAKMKDPGPITKRHRIYNAFAEAQNTRKNRTNILQFIRLALAPARYSKSPERFEPLRERANKSLAFAGLYVDETGEIRKSKATKTLSEAELRARDLRNDLQLRRIHPDVLRFCKSEYLQDNYFHAVLEAVKSVMDKLREKTGMSDDGTVLIDRALGGTQPLLLINEGTTPNHKSEQKGFVNLLKGINSMFRNTTAHEARINWNISKDDAEDLLTIVSLIHRRLDEAHIPPRV
ncbi:TIGR02391 family protein [Pseudovibrio exalbescens]|uniref:TIGR02391 family protein n=1 Tax=Pseudovibrio exalbescens TaxID=197461 RepID=UPI000C9C2A2D|nr:TIGR02391 family protein [Pseudovibrio exalbescens]